MKKTTIAILIALAVALIGCTDPNNGGLPNSGDLPNGGDITEPDDGGITDPDGRDVNDPEGGDVTDPDDGDITDPENPIPDPNKKLPGKFSATVLSDAFGSRSAARGVSLGNYTVSNSKSIYFILRNVGDFPITDITLTAGKLTAEGETFVPITDNGVTASPGQISVLETSGKATVETIIEVAVNHGNVVGLISQQYIQKADFAGATIRIDGKTIDEDDNAVDVSLDVDIGTLIKVASFELQYSVDNGITWEKAEYFLENALNFYYTIPNDTDCIKILNTGNTPLKYKAGFNPEVGNFELLNEWKDLGINERSEDLSSISLSKGFIIDTIGVAFDNSGIDDFVFRANTSVVVSSNNNNGGIPWR
jgi:hypothetical protein